MIYKNQGIIAGKRKCKSTRIKGRENREGLKLLALWTVSSNSCIRETNCPISGRANPGSSERDLVSVCKREKLVQRNSVHR